MALPDKGICSRGIGLLTAKKNPEETVEKFGAQAKSASARARGAKSGRVGDALRTVYDETVQEDIPSEMLDLLGKLS